MKVIQIGKGKSGNLWLYRIVQNIFKLAGRQTKSFIKTEPIYQVAKDWKLSFEDQAGIDTISIEPTRVYYRISSIFKMPIEDLGTYTQKVSHVWLQSHFCERTMEVLQHFDKRVYIIRDPRDVAISMSHYAQTPYQQKFFAHTKKEGFAFLNDNFVFEIGEWVRHVGSYLKASLQVPIHFVFYERLVHTFEEEIGRLTSYLGLTLDSEQIAHLKEAINFNTMRKKNPDHLRKGGSGQWQEALTSSQERKAKHIAGPLLKALHYPLTRKNDPSLPFLNSGFGVNFLDPAIRRAKNKMLLERVKQKLASLSQ